MAMECTVELSNSVPASSDAAEFEPDDESEGKVAFVPVVSVPATVADPAVAPHAATEVVATTPASMAASIRRFMEATTPPPARRRP